MPATKGRLKPADERILQANYEMLINNIDGQCFTAGLFSRFVFTFCDKEEVNCQESSNKRAQMMLDKLFESGPGNAYNAFLEILEENYPHLIERFRNTSIDQPLHRYSWLDNIPEAVKNHVITEKDALQLSFCLDANWQHVTTRLGITEADINEAKLQFPTGFIENVITALIIKWKVRNFSNATIKVFLNVLKDLDEKKCRIKWERINMILTNIGQVMH